MLRSLVGSEMCIRDRNRDLEFLWYNTNIITAQDIGISIAVFLNAVIDIRRTIINKFRTILRSIEAFQPALEYPSILTMYGAEIMYGDLSKPQPNFRTTENSSCRSSIHNI